MKKKKIWKTRFLIEIISEFYQIFSLLLWNFIQIQLINCEKNSQLLNTNKTLNNLKTNFKIIFFKYKWFHRNLYSNCLSENSFHFKEKNYTPRKIHIKQKNIDMICAEKVRKEKKKNKEITKIGVKVKYQYHIPNEITVTNTWRKMWKTSHHLFPRRHLKHNL